MLGTVRRTTTPAPRGFGIRLSAFRARMKDECAEIVIRRYFACSYRYKRNLAIANRSRFSCARKVTKTSIGNRNALKIAQDHWKCHGSVHGVSINVRSTVKARGNVAYVFYFLKDASIFYVSVRKQE